MPLTGPQKTAYNQLLQDATALKATLNHIDTDQFAVRWILCRLIDVEADVVKDHKNK